jgi:hypothetical protein
MKVNPNVERPVLFGTDGLKQSSISGLNMRNPPGWFNLYTNSSNLLITNMTLTVLGLNANAPAKASNPRHAQQFSESATHKFVFVRIPMASTHTALLILSFKTRRSSIRMVSIKSLPNKAM